MEYLKIWTSFEEIIEPLNESERGRLFTAMLHYARCEELPELKGNERFTWPIAKQAIDRARAESEKQTVNGSKGGRPKKNPEKPTETQQNPEKPTETLEEKDKEKEKINNKVSKETYMREFEVFWAAYPRHTNKKAAQQAFQKINPDADLLNIMLQSVSAWKLSQQWTKDGGQYIPHAATWLNGRRWEDEVPKAFTGKQVSAQQYTQRQYTEDELLAVSDDLLAEARANRGKTA